jgi:hypothetical protein
MTVKVFHSSPDILEAGVQEWLSENPNLIIHLITQSQSDSGRVVLTVFFTN